ncbi:MAG TPA: lysophospholipid acyltransferase family protein [Fibrobacteria bacterium]|jgi:1-acyl-sn-glycerol-3-phosphate acyltransferase|nr:lysophospholipid acyltransferase family protein [Fibrobacteria bacterium]
MTPVFRPMLARGFDTAFALVARAGLAGVTYAIPEGLSASLPAGRPVLLFGNHASNWDGFLYRRLQQRLHPGSPGTPIYSVMLESELRRFPLFRRLGGLGLDPASPLSSLAILRALKEARSGGSRSDFFVTVFPQGTTMPASKRPLEFREGVRAFARAMAPATLVPVALRYELLGSLRPRAFVTVGEAIPCDTEAPELGVLEARVTSLLDDLDAKLCAGGEAFARGENR